MALRAQNVQPADRGHFIVLDVSLRFVAVQTLRPLVGWNRILVPVVIENGSLPIFLWAFDLALCHAQLLRDSLLHQFLLGHELRIAAEQDVGTATSHVRRDRNPSLPSSLRNDFSFALVELGV